MGPSCPVECVQKAVLPEYSQGYAELSDDMVPGRGCVEEEGGWGGRWGEEEGGCPPLGGGGDRALSVLSLNTMEGESRERAEPMAFPHTSGHFRAKWMPVTRAAPLRAGAWLRASLLRASLLSGGPNSLVFQALRAVGCVCTVNCCLLGGHRVS